jgi:DNA-binding HxlR family transcriptional regulator
LAGLVKHVLARPVLSALAGDRDPLRHRDLHAMIGITGDGMVHPKTLDSALRYLCAHQLVSRTDVRPRYTTYAITDFGRDIHDALEALYRVVRAHQGVE